MKKNISKELIKCLFKRKNWKYSLNENELKYYEKNGL